jgi:manganese/zinc/iron transport system ATP- binding protein
MGTYGRLGYIRRPGKAEKQLAMRCLQQLQIEDLAQRHISELSGGQQQRTFIARALAQEAELYLLDEPFAGVDAFSEKVIFEILQGLVARGNTLVVVHHDLETAASYFQNAVLLNKKIVATGPACSVLSERNLLSTYVGAGSR